MAPKQPAKSPRRKSRASTPGGASSKLIVAIDEATLADATAVAKQLRGVVASVKIGSALFTAEGPEAVRAMRALGFRVFLDLKFHDIPSTVEKSCRAAIRHGIWMLTIHASAQPEMLSAAAAGVRDEAQRQGVEKPLVVGVTVLTSVASGNQATLTRRVVELAEQAKRCGLDGVVASANEAAAIRRRVGPMFSIVCPGIRPAAKRDADQQRVASPGQALKAGASYLVVGRPITGAGDPRRSAELILNDMGEE